MGDIDKKIDEIFTKSVGGLIDPGGIFRKKLTNKAKGKHNKDIIIKFGVDPTTPDIHLGHAVVLRKLRALQDLGCKVVFLVGDFTARIGDPSGKSKIRPEIEQEEVEKNMKTYLEQIDKILLKDKNVFSWIRNSEWFYGISDMQPKKGVNISMWGRGINPSSFVGKSVFYEETRMQKTKLGKKEIHNVTLRGLMWALKHITHAQLIQRDMFQERIKKGGELYMHEMLYPVLQGVDSQIIGEIYGGCDIEIGGTDQTFNMLMGRDVMKANKQPPQSVMSMKILEGIDGKEKMSKSLGNYIAITDKPSDMYGKVMSIPDSSIIHYYELCTFTPPIRIEEIKSSLMEEKTNPRDIKMELAKQIVAIYHGEKEAIEAEKSFVNTFQKKEIPDDIQEVFAKKEEKLVDVIVSEKIVKSKNEARRLISDGAVKEIDNDKKITDADYLIEENLTLKIGKKRFIKISVN